MKVIFVWYCFSLSVLLQPWNVCAQYTIHGTVKGNVTGNVLLISSSHDKKDTLAIAEIKNGRFTIKGGINEITCATLVIDGMLSAQLFLENNEVFNVEFESMKAPEVFGGGWNQHLSREFRKIEEKKILNLRGFVPRLAEAYAQKDSLAIDKIQEERTSVLEKSQEEKENFYQEYGETFFVLHDLARRAFGMSVDDVRKAFDRFSDELKATSPGRYIANLLPKLAKIAIGAVVPDFISTTSSGGKISLYEVKSKVKLIDFWSSNCGRCRVENRLIRPIYEQYHDKGFEVIGYSLDTKRDLWLEAIAEDKLPWIQVSDLGGLKMKFMIENYGIWSLPANLLVDKDNKVIARNITSEELGKLLPKLLEKD